MLPRDDMLYTQTEQMNNIIMENTKEERIQKLNQQKHDEKIRRIEARLLKKYNYDKNKI